MPVKQVLEGGRVPVRVWTDELDAATRQQLLNVAQLPIVFGHVATVGSVIATRSAIIPSGVGVDIGCGMCAAQTTLTASDLDEKRLTAIFHQIGRDVPVGFGQHEPERAHTGQARRFERGLRSIRDKHPGLMKRMGKHSDWTRQLGSLGGGNHFIEVCLDEAQQVWVMLHSGSRGIGNAIGTYFIELAREEMLALDAQLPDRDLAYLTEGTVHFDDYVEAVGWAQDYARENRAVMLDLVLDALRRHLPPFTVTREAVQCHHNYVQRERHFGEDLWITRKGAIRAGAGELGIIPGSMGAKSYIVRGKGNPESFHSSAHGAGRRLSRHAAARQYTAAGVVDEIPAAYKDIGAVMANQDDLVEVVHTLRQLLCVKG
jgi:tRNA-splicing ligase RtcB